MSSVSIDRGRCHKLKLKRLCTTRWSSRIDAVRAVKNRYRDILKVITRISLESKDPKERSEAISLKKNLENFEFIVFVVIWERILSSLNKASLQLQSVQIDMSVAVRLLSMAADDMRKLRNSWESVLSYNPMTFNVTQPI